MNEIQERIAEDMATATKMGDEDVMALILVWSQVSTECNEMTEQGLFREPIERADRGIERLEQHIASNPSVKTILGFTLSQLYMMKAICYTQLGQTDVSLKRQALQNVENCFRVTNLPPHLGAGLLQLKQGLEREIAMGEQGTTRAQKSQTSFPKDEKKKGWLGKLFG